MKLDGICKVYDKGMDETVILDDISLSIEEKSFITILGPSGCGKSTMLKIMGGLERPTLGAIELCGKRYQKGFPKSQLKNIGIVFQQNAMLEWRTVRKNLKLNLELFRLRGPEWEQRIDEMLSMVGLQDYQNIFPYELSGGMQQRLGIARSLVHDPKILLMDQPFGALDAITRRMLAIEVFHIWRKTQKTIVMVTNDVEEALLLSSRVIVMSSEGKIIHDITNDIPEESRLGELLQNERFNTLRAELNAITHQQDNLKVRRVEDGKG